MLTDLTTILFNKIHKTMPFNVDYRQNERERERERNHGSWRHLGGGQELRSQFKITFFDVNKMVQHT